MIKYKFIELCKEMKIDIPVLTNKKFGIEITPDSLEKDDFLQSNILNIIKEKSSLVKDLESTVLDDIEEDGIECSDEERNMLHQEIKQLNGIILDMQQYQNDMLADVFMGYLYVDPEYTVFFDSDMKNVWDCKECNSANNRENEIKHYPYVKNREVLIEGIPGGGNEFHKLMISNSNMVLFDIGTETKSIKRYAFPKTHMIYESLKEFQIDNLLLLEKTQGIECTNLLFHYVKTFELISDLVKVQDIIRKVAEIKPIFLRKKVVEIIWNYMNSSDYSENSIVFAKSIMSSLVYVINLIYSKILEFAWYTYYSAIRDGSNGNLLYNIKLCLDQICNNYYNADEAYESWITSEELNDWRGIEKVEDCFYYIRTKDGYREYDLLHNCNSVLVKTLDGNKRFINIENPINELGEKIKKMAIQEISRISPPPLSDEELLKSYYEMREKSYCELRDAEIKLWKDKDFKIPKEKIEPMHAYALVHSVIVSKLNEIEEDKSS